MIDRFRGEYGWLSNFHPVEVVYEGITFPSVENAYQAAKTLSIGARSAISQMTAAEAKKAGKNVVVRGDWGSIKLTVMNGLLRQKFSYSDLRAKLVATGDEEIIEGNTWGDTFWGKCNGEGENHLGLLLMEIRKTCQATNW